MKRLVLFPALLGLAFVATAQTSAPVPVEPATPQQSSTPAAAATAPQKYSARDDIADRNCLKQTGSHLAPVADRKGRTCVNASGRAYDRKAIDRTGATDLKDALRKLDPAVH